MRHDHHQCRVELFSQIVGGESLYTILLLYSLTYTPVSRRNLWLTKTAVLDATFGLDEVGDNGNVPLR